MYPNRVPFKGSFKGFYKGLLAKQYIHRPQSINIGTTLLLPKYVLFWHMDPQGYKPQAYSTYKPQSAEVRSPKALNPTNHKPYSPQTEISQPETVTLSLQGLICQGFWAFWAILSLGDHAELKQGSGVSLISIWRPRELIVIVITCFQKSVLYISSK